MSDRLRPDPDGPSREPVEIDTSIAHPARLRNVLAGGNDNFTADRKAAEYAAGQMPGGFEAARATIRSMGAFVVRVVQHLSEGGVDQYIHIGAPIPTAEDVHVVAQRVVPEARIVYVGDDPVVLAHAHALRQSSPTGAAAYVHGKLSDIPGLLRGAAETVDLDRPVGLLLVGTLSFVADKHDPHGMVKRLMGALCSGSYLAVGHSSAMYEGIAEAAQRVNEQVRGTFQLRTRDEIMAFFDGLELIEPGLVQIDQWRPTGDGPTGREAAILEKWPVPLYAGVGRKP